MPAKDLGVKHVCWKCGAKFYDLKKPDPACPKCGADPRQAPQTKSSPAAERRRAREAAALEEAADPVEEKDKDADDEEEVDEPDDASALDA
jgi:uncharacterized protein (TIGR02300 family)